MGFWLMKSEPDVFSFEDLMKRPGRREHWDGVRNYQARNFMRDDMRVGDLILFYHSNCKPPHVAGVARVAREGYADHTAQDPKSNYFDEKAGPEDPRWYMVDVEGVAALPEAVSLAALRENPALAQMRLVQKGNRLSVLPVEEEEFDEILRMGGLARSKVDKLAAE